MKLLHVLHSLDRTYGGPIRAVLDLSARALEFGLESEVLGFGDLDVPDTLFPRANIHSLPMSRPHSYCYSPGLKAWLRENLARFDGVILHGMWLYPNLAVSSVCREMGIAYACFPHGMLEPWAVFRQGTFKALKKMAYWGLFEKQIIHGAKCIYFTTERERVLARETFHLGGAMLILAPYGVEDAAQFESPLAMPGSTGLEDSKVALFLGRLHPKKNVKLLIEAWHLAQPPQPWKLVLAGSGDEHYTRELVKLVHRLGLRESVHFVGFVSGSDKKYWLEKASWFLLPSQQENFGVAVLEAVTHGCPVVISDQVFVAELMHAQTEVLSLDIEEWVKFLRHRMVDEEWRQASIALNQTHLSATLSIHTVSRQWAAVLTQTFS